MPIRPPIIGPLPFALCLLAFALLFAAPAWAGSDMSSTHYKIRRSDLNSGGSANPASAHYKMTSTVGSRGGSLFAGTTYFVYSGFSNLVSHPDAVEDLAVIPGPAVDQMVLTFTAPTAYGSSGTAAAYAVRQQAAPFSDELSFVNATPVVNAWSPLPPGALEARTLSGLAANTTYYFAIKGADQAGNTGYISNNAGASTLTDAASGIQITNVYQSSATLAWTSLGAGNAEGYVVQASTRADFNAAIQSTATPDVNVTTLTDLNLRRGKLTYFRLGGLNWNNVANFVSAGSTVTLPGPPPSNLVLASVYSSSVTLVWGGAPSDDGYSAEAYADGGFTALAQSSTTADVAATGLVIQNLYANATYYLRVGSLYDDATNYASPMPVSTITVAAIPTAGVLDSVTPSTISFSWNPSINTAGTQFEAQVSTVSDFGVFTATEVVISTTATFSNLTQDTTYWVRVRALGWAGADSPYLVVGSSVTGALTKLFVPTLTGFSDVELSSLTVSWIPTGGPLIVYDVDLAPADPFGAHMTLTAAGSSATLAGLAIDSIYSARVRAHSLVTGQLSDYSNFMSTSTLAEPPVLLSTTSVTNASVVLSWNGNGNPSNTLYSIERSTDGMNYTTAGAVRATSYSDLGLLGGTVYAYRVRAINESGVPSAYSNVVSVMTTGIPLAPKRPYGIWIERTDLGGGTFSVAYHWHRVTERTDGSALSNLSGYHIYTSDSLLKPRAQWTLAATIPTETWSVNANAGTATYYALKAFDANGLESDWTQILDDTVDMNHFFLSDDNISRIQIPQSAAQVLRSERNSYGDDLWIDFVSVISEETGRVVRSVKIRILSSSTGNEIKDLVFDPPVVKGTLAYSVVSGNVVAGAPEPPGLFASSAKSAIIRAADAAQQLSLFWYNGAEWIKTTGFVNTADNTMSFTSSHLGDYQIRAATHGSGATLTRVYPRIITPNGDGWNDKAIFQFDNPQLLPLTGKIYDISGAFVSSLKVGPNPDTSLAWDGKDSGGKTVPGGIYLYQIDLGGAAESGTIVVAR